MLKNRVNAITIDANDLTVRRGGNVFTQLGIGLVDQNLGDIKTDSIDDLTIKANLAEQTLREAIDSGLIDEKVGREKLDIFLKAQPIQLEEISNVQKVLRKMLTVDLKSTCTLNKIKNILYSNLKTNISDYDKN